MIEQLEIELELMKSKYNQLMEKVSAQSTEIAVMNNQQDAAQTVILQA